MMTTIITAARKITSLAPGRPRNPSREDVEGADPLQKCPWLIPGIVPRISARDQPENRSCGTISRTDQPRGIRKDE
jgi:hypothetical protein